MLIKFKAENFRSLRDEQELSLVAGAGKELRETVLEEPSVPPGLLRIAAIYGPNASGKTSILRALAYMQRVVLQSYRTWQPSGEIPREPFLFDQRKDEPSSFQIDFINEGSPVQFGFAVSDTEVLREWVYAFPNGRKQVWYERGTHGNKTIRFGKSLTGENRQIESLTRPNCLFLSAAAQNNHEMLLPIFDAITKRISFSFGYRGEAEPHRVAICADPDKARMIVPFLRAADLGISGVESHREPVDDKQKRVIKTFFSAFREAYPESADAEFKIPETVPKFSLRHKGAVEEDRQFPVEYESAGTLAFLNLLCPTFEALESGGILCVDEIDSSLHPLLAMEFVKLFHDPKNNPKGAQLVFNTHDTNLLDESILRRDEIWFTEKDDKGATHLYSLADFMPHKRENLKRGYLQGRFGAIPFVSNLSFGLEPK
jgi:hypothetical protein